MAKHVHIAEPRTRAAEATRFAAPRRRRARKQREGIVILVVMLMIMMATGTAMFAIQATQYEQRAATSVAEANWARGVAECATMAGLAYVEDYKTKQASGISSSLDFRWVSQGGAQAQHSVKYGLPAPIAVDDPGAGATPDIPYSASLNLPPVIESAPGAQGRPGLQGFLPGPRRRNSAFYPLFADHDDDTNTTAGLRSTNGHWLQEELPGIPLTVEKGKTQTTRTRTVVTGFAEITVIQDGLDSTNIRGLHELDAITRGYVDKIQ